MTTPDVVSPSPATLTVTVPVTISLERIADLLVSALEGGSNYWYNIKEFVKPSTSFRVWDTSFRHIDYPLSPDGALIFSVPEDDDGKTYRLDRAACQKGLQIMAQNFPRHFANFTSENDDAETGDVFLQCALFGDVIFG